MKDYFRKNVGHFARLVLFVAIATVFAVQVQFLKGDVLDDALSMDAAKAFTAGASLLLAIFGEIGFYFLYDLAKGRLVANAMRDLRADYMRSLLLRPFHIFAEKTEGEYIAQFSKELDSIEQEYFTTWPCLIAVLIKIFIVGGSLLFLDVQMAFLTFFLLTMPLYVPKLIEKKLQQAQRDYLDKFESQVKKLNDWLKGFELIKSFKIEGPITRLFDEANARLCEADWQKRKINDISRSLSAILSYLSHFFILAFAAFLVSKGRFSAGKFFVAIGMIDQLSYPIISISSFIQSLVAVKPVNEKVEKFLAFEHREEKKVSLLPEKFEKLVLDGLSYGYDERLLFRSLDWCFGKNKKYLIQGQSGSGKTTVINLMLNYLIPEKGEILINETPIGKVGNLFSLVTIMRQEAVLFSDSLRNNLTMYRGMPDEELLRVLSSVGLTKFAEPSGLDQMIQADGSNLSGGEKKRITLARSLLNDTPILILDEPLANLDDGKVGQIENIIAEIHDRTVIVISHQFSEKKRSIFEKVYILK